MRVPLASVHNSRSLVELVITASPEKQPNPIGEWNTFEITMKGDRLTVILNGHLIIENAQIPEVPESGPIAFQHHGGKRKDGTFSPASSLMQFRNVFVKKLD